MAYICSNPRAWTERQGSVNAQPRINQVCPDSIVFSHIQQTLLKKVKGWEEIVQPITHRLKSVKIVAGVPKKSTSLSSDTLKADTIQTGRAVWLVKKHEKKHWMVCSYYSTSLQLTKQIDSGIQRIEIIYDTTWKAQVAPTISRVSLHNNSISSFSLPFSIESSQIQQNLFPVVSGWIVLQDSSAYALESIQIYDGHPRELAALIPDTTNENERRCVWLLAGKKSHYWIGCSYYNTTLMLVKQIDTCIKKVEVFFDSMPQLQESPPIRSIRRYTK